MQELNISADELFEKLLELSRTETVCLLDSCGVEHLGSHLLIAGICPVDKLEVSETDPARALDILNENVEDPNCANIFTLSYDFGLRLIGIEPDAGERREPDVFIANFECVIVHDYSSGKTTLRGNEHAFGDAESMLASVKPRTRRKIKDGTKLSSNFTKREYLENVEKIKEYIRDGETYQTNLTQQFRGTLPNGLGPREIFRRLRTDHPAPFSAFLKRKNDFVVSISPERFATIKDGRISTSPIKGTRPRGSNQEEDRLLRKELRESDKDRAENIMIVDLLRNDIGRVCEFGSVEVEKLCDLEEHPTLFHLVSTVTGKLRQGVSFSDVIEAIFPCGSITGCPKIRTMQIIDEIETLRRGLSMGAIGYSDFDGRIDMNVAIRTIVIRGAAAFFNVGGGIVIDSDPEAEYLESLTKAKAIFRALGATSNSI